MNNDKYLELINYIKKISNIEKEYYDLKDFINSTFNLKNFLGYNFIPLKKSNSNNSDIFTYLFFKIEKYLNQESHEFQKIIKILNQNENQNESYISQFKKIIIKELNNYIKAVISGQMEYFFSSFFVKNHGYDNRNLSIFYDVLIIFYIIKIQYRKDFFQEIVQKVLLKLKRKYGMDFEKLKKEEIKKQIKFIINNKINSYNYDYFFDKNNYNIIQKFFGNIKRKITKIKQILNPLKKNLYINYKESNESYLKYILIETKLLDNQLRKDPNGIFGINNISKYIFKLLKKEIEENINKYFILDNDTQKDIIIFWVVTNFGQSKYFFDKKMALAHKEDGGKIEQGEIFPYEKEEKEKIIKRLEKTKSFKKTLLGK